MFLKDLSLVNFKNYSEFRADYVSHHLEAKFGHRGAAGVRAPGLGHPGPVVAEGANLGGAAKDFSGIIKLLDGSWRA